MERREVLRIGIAAVLVPDGLVAGRTGVAPFLAGELEDDPVGGFHEARRRVVDLRRLVQDLQNLGNQPLGRYLPTVARQEGFAACAGDGVDCVGLWLGCVVLPELDPRMWVTGKARVEAQRLAGSVDRQYGARRKVDAQADDIFGCHARLL